MNRLISIILLLLGLFFALSSPVLAAGPGFGQELVTFQNTLVPAGQVVKNVLLIGQDGVIAGEVKDEVVVIKGSVTLMSTAKVADRVLVIGGQIKQEPGAQVGKGVFNISTSNDTVNSLLLGIVAFAGIELIKLGLSISIILSALIVVMVAPNLARNSAEKLKSGLLKSTLSGILAMLCFSLLIAALFASVLGIPLAILLLLLFMIILLIGCAGMGLIVGELFKNSLESSLKSTMLTTAIGTLILVSMLNLPIVGPIWGLVMIIPALGSTVQVAVKSKGSS